MNLGERLRVAFQMCGLSAPQVSRATGVKVATINALLRRESSERSSFLEDILTVLPPSKVSHDWLRTGRGTPDPKVIGLSSQSKEVNRGPVVSVARGTNTAQKTAALATAPLRAWEYEDALPEEGGWVFIPKLGIIPAPADGAYEEIKTVLLVEEVQAFRAEWIREDQLKPAALAWSQALDASMAKVIYEGDSYVIDTSDTTIVDGKTYSIWYGGAEKVRRLFRLPGGGLRIKPENDDFDRLDLGAETAKHLRIIGRVVHRAGKGGL